MYVRDSEILSKSTEMALTTLDENRKKLQSIFLLQTPMQISMDKAITESMNKQVAILGDVIDAVTSITDSQEMILSAVQDIKRTLDSSATGIIIPLEPRYIQK
jgi:uncharacterized iron-regulated protein